MEKTRRKSLEIARSKCKNCFLIQSETPDICKHCGNNCCNYCIGYTFREFNLIPKNHICDKCYEKDMELLLCDRCEEFSGKYSEKEFNRENDMIFECEKCGNCVCACCQALGYIQSMDTICKDCFSYKCENCYEKLPSEFYIYDEACPHCGKCIIRERYWDATKNEYF